MAKVANRIATQIKAAMRMAASKRCRLARLLQRSSFAEELHPPLSPGDPTAAQN